MNTMMEKCNGWMGKCSSQSLGLLFIRLSLAIVFLTHGIAKFSDMEGTIAFFGSLGLGAFFAWLVAIVETVGGAFMLLGLWTCFTGASLAVVMVMAIILVKSKMGFPAIEIDIAMLASSLAVMVMGSGKYGLNKCCKMCMNKSNCCGGVCGGSHSCCGSEMKCDGCEANCKDGVCSGHEGK